MAIPALPPKVAAAVSQVMKGVRRLEKDEKNKHGNYQFTSVDSFLDATRPLCAAAGLVIIPDEDTVDMVETTSVGDQGGTKKATWLKIRFVFTLSHESGETWEHSPGRTVMVNTSMGSQAYGAAQSYAMKQFLRALFQIATGDGEDADTQPNEALPQTRRSPPPAARQPPSAPPVAQVRQAPPVALVAPEEALAYAATAETEIMNADDAGDLIQWWNADEQKQARREAGLTADLLAKLKDAVSSRASELRRRGLNGAH